MMHDTTFMKGELIGLPVRIQNCTDPSLQGVEGRLVDETKNTLVIGTPHGVKRVAKDIATFVIDGVTVRGADIAFRPEDRIRKIK
ncbi:MAG: ribonuclease P protein subunit [Candidatus Thermoplasmatota archaeon]|nr:ribonuclease P protein subunit [Candidatus Thermoplasmatota archaeon]